MTKALCVELKSVFAVVLWLWLVFNSPSFGIAQSSNTVTGVQVEEWMTELSNWGRWGKQDEKGALNLITAAKR